MLHGVLQTIRRGGARSGLARELTWTLLLKAVALFALWWILVQPRSGAPLTGDSIGQHVLDAPAVTSDSAQPIKDSKQ
jgi:hypothetical protein